MLQAKNKEKSLNLLSSTLSSLLTFCLLLNLLSPLLYLSPSLSSSSFSLSSSTNKKIKILNDETLKNIKGKGIEEKETKEEEGEKEEDSQSLLSEDDFSFSLLDEDSSSDIEEESLFSEDLDQTEIDTEILKDENENENEDQNQSDSQEMITLNEKDLEEIEEISEIEGEEEEEEEEKGGEENSQNQASPYLFIQEDEYSCGPASLVTLFSLLLDIKDYSLQKELYQKIINSISLSEKEGSSLFSLKKSAEDLSKDLLPSFSPKAIKTDIETLISEKDTLAPSLIFITPAQNPHFSVLSKIEIKEEEKGKDENQEKDKDLSENENQIEESSNDQTKDENTEEFDQDQTEKENVSQIEEEKEEKDECSNEDQSQSQKDTESIEENNEKGEKEDNGDENDSSSSSILFYLLDPYLGEVSLDKEEFSSIFSGVLMYFDKKEEKKGEKEGEENEKEIKEDEAKNEEEIISDDDILNLKGKGKVKWKVKKKRYSSKNKKSFSFEKPTLSLFAWVTNPKPLYLKYIPSTKSYSVAKVPKNSIGIVISKKYIFYNGKLFWFVYFYPLKTQKRKRAYYGWAWQGDLRKISQDYGLKKIHPILPSLNPFSPKAKTLVYLKISFITKKLSSLDSDDSYFLLKGTPGKIIGGPKREDVFVWWRVLWLKPKIISWALQGVLALPKFKKYDRVSPNYKSYNKRKTTLRLYNVASFKKYTSFRAISPSWVGIIVAGPYFNETYVWYHVKWYKSLRFKKFIVRGWVIENYLRFYPAKFKRGDKVKVVRVGRSRLRTRAYPSLKARIIDALPLGSIGQILEGPIKANGYTWWKIKWFSSKKKIGWSAENWLQKLPSKKTSQKTIVLKTLSLVKKKPSFLSQLKKVAKAITSNPIVRSIGQGLLGDPQDVLGEAVNFLTDLFVIGDIRDVILYCPKSLYSSLSLALMPLSILGGATAYQIFQHYKQIFNSQRIFQEIANNTICALSFIGILSTIAPQFDWLPSIGKNIVKKLSKTSPKLVKIFGESIFKNLTKKGGKNAFESFSKILLKLSDKEIKILERIIKNSDTALLLQKYFAKRGEKTVRDLLQRVGKWVGREKMIKGFRSVSKRKEHFKHIQEILNWFSSDEIFKLIRKETIETPKDLEDFIKQLLVKRNSKMKKILYYHNESRKLARLGYLYEITKEKEKALFLISIDEKGNLVTMHLLNEGWNYLNHINKKLKHVFGEIIPLDELPVKIKH